MTKHIIKGVLFAAAISVLWFYKKSQKKSPANPEKVLNIAVIAGIRGLDPAQTSDVYSARELSKIYEGLLEYHYLKRPFTLQANLAEAMPTISADGLVYTFKIRQGIKFHDNTCFPHGKGRELVAEDFVYSMKRVADPKVQATHFSLLAGKIKGMDEWRTNCIKTSQAAYTAPIEGIQALERYTLQFTLNQPFPQFLYVLAMCFCYVVPQEAVQHYGVAFLNHPVGTGPFVIKEFNPQENKIVYHKNPTFRKKFFPSEAAPAYQHLLADAGKQLPLVDKIISHIITEEQPAWLQFQKGQLDILNVNRSAATLEIIDAQTNTLQPALQQKGMQLFNETSIGTHFFVFNHKNKLFQHNTKLRQAISMAFDNETYNKLFFNSIATLAQSIIPPGLAGYQKDYKNPYKAYNLEKAKRLLAEAGYPGGKGLPPITLDIHSNTIAKQKGDFFAKCMAAIGIKIEVIQNIWPELQEKYKKKKSTMIHYMGWSAPYPDAETFLFLLSNIEEGVGLGANFKDSTFDALYKKASMMQDSPQRTMYYEQLNKMAAESVPVVYTIHMPNLHMQQGWVKNYNFSDFHYDIDQYLAIELTKKEAIKAQL